MHQALRPPIEMEQKPPQPNEDTFLVVAAFHLLPIVCYSLTFGEKPSEKPWTHLVRSLTGHRKRFISAHCDLRALPNPHSERYSHPFSDSFGR